MKVDIKNKKDNQLFKRTEVKFTVAHDGEATPARKQVLQLLKTQLNSEFIVIKSVNTPYGKNESNGVAYVFKNKQDMEKGARDYLIKRDTKAPKEKKAEPTPAPAEEAKSDGKSRQDKPKEDQTTTDQEKNGEKASEEKTEQATEEGEEQA